MSRNYVQYDPESMITQSEVERGLTYYDKRLFLSRSTLERVQRGEIDHDTLAVLAPRTLLPLNLTTQRFIQQWHHVTLDANKGAV